jgi:putative glutamine amidotransferase
VQPLIGITGRRWPGRGIAGLPANFADLGMDLHVGGYADSVERAGGIAVLLPCSDSAIAALDRLDGVVLSGGSDVDPARYGQQPHPTVTDVDHERDRIEIEIARVAIERRLPLLAVCRGMQVLNVALGGTLIQHLEPGHGDHHAAWDLDPDGVAHTVTFEAGSLAAACYGASVGVNSLHHQAVDRLAEALAPTGRATDGTVESTELPGHPLLAVQWHPELMPGDPEPSFAWLVATARTTSHLSRSGPAPDRGTA